MRIALLLDRIRVEEKLLLAEFRRRSALHLEALYLQDLMLDPDAAATFQDFDLVLDRSISQSRGEVALGFAEAAGIPTLNRAAVARRCGDKVATSLALARAAVPQPKLRVATSTTAALAAMDELGYPVVVKPTVGSWGRLLARLNDRDAAEALLEHKVTLGGHGHGIFYIQEYVPKPQRDLRVFVLGDQVLCAIARHSDHWITNTARGARTVGHPVDATLEDLCLRASQAVGGGILAIDLLESPRGLLVNEINSTMEFRNSIAPTGVDIPARLVDYVTAVAGRGGSTMQRPTHHESAGNNVAVREMSPC